MIPSTPIAQREAEAAAGNGTVRAADADEALPRVAGAAAEARVEYERLRKLLRWLALLAWLLMRPPKDETVRRPKRKPKDDVSPPLAHTATSILRSSTGEEDSTYSTGTYSPYDSPSPSTAHAEDSRYFPETNYFPPPPNASADPNIHNPYPPYNPADYPPGPNHSSQYVNVPRDESHIGNPYVPPQHQDHYYGPPRRMDGNVSAPAPDRAGSEHDNLASERGAFGSRPGGG